MQNNAEQSSTWLDRPLTQNIHISWEVGILVLLLVLAVISRFYILDARVMSHDETIARFRHMSWHYRIFCLATVT